MSAGKLKAVISGSKQDLALIRAGWRCHHLDGRIKWIEPPTPKARSAKIEARTAQIEQAIWNGFIGRGISIDGNLIAIDREGIKEIAKEIAVSSGHDSTGVHS